MSVNNWRQYCHEMLTCVLSYRFSIDAIQQHHQQLIATLHVQWIITIVLKNNVFMFSCIRYPSIPFSILVVKITQLHSSYSPLYCRQISLLVLYFISVAMSVQVRNSYLRSLSLYLYSMDVRRWHWGRVFIGVPATHIQLQHCRDNIAVLPRSLSFWKYLRMVVCITEWGTYVCLLLFESHVLVDSYNTFISYKCINDFQNDTQQWIMLTVKVTYCRYFRGYWLPWRVDKLHIVYIGNLRTTQC